MRFYEVKKGHLRSAEVIKGSPDQDLYLSGFRSDLIIAFFRAEIKIVKCQEPEPSGSALFCLEPEPLFCLEPEPAP